MSDETPIRPTDDQLAEWADTYLGMAFPPYYDSDHDRYLQGMFEELIELRAANRQCLTLTPDVLVSGSRYRCQLRRGHGEHHYVEVEQSPGPPMTLSWPLRDGC